MLVRARFALSTFFLLASSAGCRAAAPPPTAPTGLPISLPAAGGLLNVGAVAEPPTAPEPAAKETRSAARRAYELIARGDLTSATPDYARARVELDADGLVDERPSLRGALGLLRLDAERQQRANGEARPDVDCTVFEKHGADALWAYSAWFASTRDTYAFEIKHQCFDETLAGVSSLEATRARTAKDRIVSAMLTAIPIPEGTMYQGMALGAADAVVDVLLSPEAVTTANGNADLAAATKRHPKRRAAVAPFTKVRDTETPALAGGVCAVLHARGHATTRARCEEIASSAASYAMARWIGATSDPIGNYGATRLRRS